MSMSIKQIMHNIVFVGAKLSAADVNVLLSKGGVKVAVNGQAIIANVKRTCLNDSHTLSKKSSRSCSSLILVPAIFNFRITSFIGSLRARRLIGSLFVFTVAKQPERLKVFSSARKDVNKLSNSNLI